MPLTPGPPLGVAAGVAGVTPFAPLFCWEGCCGSFSDGGVRSPAPPGKDSELDAVKAFAC
jgi:hypothetical protein